MKMVLMLMLSIFAAGASATGSTRIRIEPQVATDISTSPYQYQFKLYDTQSKVYLSDSNLSTSHERKLHFIVYDAALEEFQHVHPTASGDVWFVELNFLVSGRYVTWAQGKIKQGPEFSSSSELNVQTNIQSWPLPPALSDIREGTDGVSYVTLGNTALKAGQMAMLDLTFSRTDTSAPEITPYLGAVAHVVAVPTTADELVHVHPIEGNSDNEAMLHVTFPNAGFYRLWIEFMDGGILKRVPLAVEVN